MPVRSAFCSPFSRMSVRRSSYGVLIFVMVLIITYVLWRWVDVTVLERKCA